MGRVKISRGMVLAVLTGSSGSLYGRWWDGGDARLCSKRITRVKMYP